MDNNKLNTLERDAGAAPGESRRARLERLFANAEGREDISRRGEFVKHFNLGGSRRQAIQYAQPVHYRDESGAWAEIDNTLEEGVNAQGRRVLRNRANPVRMEFPCEADGGSMAAISCGERTFCWRFEQEVQPAAARQRSGAELRQERLVERAAKLPKFAGRTVESLRGADLAAEIETAQERRMEIPMLRAENRYNEVLPGVSVRYELMGGALKEDIILAGPAALDRAAIRLPDEYGYAVSDAQELQVLDRRSGEALFTMDAPLVYDAAGNSVHGGIRLTARADYTRMEYVIDPEFLESAAWPVTIDPVIRYAKSRSSIQDAGLYRTEAPNTPHYGKEDYNCGNRGAYEYITLVRFAELVKQKASDTIVAAMVGMHPTSSMQQGEYMACYPIKKAWSASTATWNNMVPDTTEYISDEVISYVDTTGSNCYFDITDLYRSWYQKDRNFGVAFRYPLGVDGSNHFVTWAGAKRNSENGPCMVVNYLSHAGLESWWEYESMGAGRVGTAHVDLFNGNLVFEHADVASSGSRMPVSVTHYYNSCLALTNEQGCGLGWRTSANQSLYKTSMPDANWNTVNYYVWTDGDGTEHYFPVKGSSPYKDEETKTLKLTVSGSTATIRSKDDTAMRFPLPTNTARKYITGITDACGNAASFAYDSSGLLTGITDGAGRTTGFTYANGMLAKIQAPDQQSVSFEYTNQRLTKITHSNLGAAVLSYDASGLLKEAGNPDGGLGGVGVQIGYQDVNSYDASAIYGIESCKVASLTQTGIANRGAALCFDYLTGMTRVTSLKSGDALSPVGKTISYQFNVNGNLVCAFDELGYAQRADFDDSNAEKLSSRMQRAVVNLARNLAFDGGWTYAKGSAGDVLAQDNSTRCLSMPSLKIAKAGAGEAAALQEAQISRAGRYTFSAYVKADGLTGGGAFLRISSGSTAAASAIVRGSTGGASCGPAAEGWERVYATLNAPVGSVTLELACDASAGTAHFACPQLEAGETANRASLLANGDFARTVSNAQNPSANRLFPQDWTPASGISTDALNCVRTSGHGMPAFLSGNALQMVSFPASDGVGFNQEIPVSGAENDVFVIGGWVNSHSVSSGSDHSAPCIAYRFTGGNSDGKWNYLDFNREWIGWQFGAWAVVAKNSYTGFTFSVNYARNAQTAMFSNMFMYREQFGQSFDYDSNKNLISVQNLAGQKSNMEYDTFDNLTSYIQPGAADTDKYKLTYGSDADKKKHLVHTSTTPMGIAQEFQYDAYGNLTLSKTVDGTNAVMGSKTEYNTTGNYPTVTYDARGNIVTREVDASSGLLKSVTDPTRQKVTYTYDAAKRVTEVMAQVKDPQTNEIRTYKNTYAYEKDRIRTVAHNTTGDTCDVVYHFNYDGLGRKTSVSVGEQVLSTNVYSDDRSGLLTEVVYGNGTEANPQKVKYSYDDFDRLTGVSYDSETTPRYSYTYDASGEVAKVTDHHLNRTVETERDLAFRPRQSTLKDAGGNTLYRTTLYYDGRNRLEKFAEHLGSADYASAYAYDKDSRTTQITFSETSGGASGKLTYAYDALGRARTRTATIGSNNYTTTYGYAAGNASLYGANATTPLVASITQGSGANAMNFAYTYDSRGNIVSETRNGKTTTYAYDALGQLVQVDDPHERTTWKYYYDLGGNITKKEQYAWPAGATSAPSSLGSPTKTIPYVYGDSTWKDKLTKYNGKAITYDAIGNPLNDGERTYTWGAGRQLRHISMLTGEEHGFRVNNGVHEDSNTLLRIVHDAANSKLKAKLLRNGRDITDECAASAFVWTKAGSAAGTGKEIAVSEAEVNGDVQFSCTYTETQGVYGTVSVNDGLVASHTPATADANHAFTLENGMLKVEIPNSAGNGTNYELIDGVLSVNPGFTGTLTAEYAFTTAPTREVDFEYDHNGLRTQKRVVENGITTIYDYTLHGKLITHLTKRVVDLDGVETSEELHFFYDAQSKPTFVEYEGAVYRYIHNLQGDIVAIVDDAGNPVVEYKYDAWGKMMWCEANNQNPIGRLNLFRYRNYVFDEEVGFYYLKSRFYDAGISRFINQDSIILPLNMVGGSNLFVYCKNTPICGTDPSGRRYIDAMSVQAETSAQRKAAFKATKEARIRSRVNVYKSNDNKDIPGMINMRVYEVKNEAKIGDEIKTVTYWNVHVSESLSLQERDQIDAALEVFMESEYYSEDVFGTKAFMRAQWIAHNATYGLADSGSEQGVALARVLSGSNDPKASAAELDLRCLDNLLRRQKIFYGTLTLIHGE